MPSNGNVSDLVKVLFTHCMGQRRARCHPLRRAFRSTLTVTAEVCVGAHAPAAARAGARKRCGKALERYKGQRRRAGNARYAASEVIRVC